MPFEPGQSGNPGGRPKSKPFADALRMEIAAAGADHKALREVARALLTKAAEGDVPAINALADRLDGKVPQAVEGEMNHTADNPLLALLGRIAAQGQPLVAKVDDSAD